jgi:hypothetical protein
MSQRHIRELVLACSLALGASAAHCAGQADLVAALAKSKLTLADGIREATKDGGVAISAKFEFDDAGKLSLSVYSAKKGISVAAEENVLEELSGSPEQSPWKAEVEVFKDGPHVARSSEQLALLSLTRLTLLDLISKAQPAHRGIVFSITPEIKQRKPVAVVLVANGGKVTELTYNLLDGKVMETRHP